MSVDEMQSVGFPERRSWERACPRPQDQTSLCCVLPAPLVLAFNPRSPGRGQEGVGVVLRG